MNLGLVLRGFVVACVIVLVNVSAYPTGAQTTSDLSAKQVIAAFERAGLPVQNLHQERVYGTPSGPPITEKEVWRFSIPDVAPSGGKIMVFDSTVRKSRKLAWFSGLGVHNLVVRKNVILWLDPGLKGSRVAAYRKVLVNL